MGSLKKKKTFYGSVIVCLCYIIVRLPSKEDCVRGMGGVSRFANARRIRSGRHVEPCCAAIGATCLRLVVCVQLSVLSDRFVVC
jgi:hypothetical protein